MPEDLANNEDKKNKSAKKPAAAGVKPPLNSSKNEKSKQVCSSNVKPAKNAVKPAPQSEKSDGLISSEEMANVFGMSTRYIQQLTKDGILTAVEVGKKHRYDLVSTVQQYIKHLQDKVSGKDKAKGTQIERDKLKAELDMKRAQAKIKQLELKELEGSMHESKDVEAMTSDLVLAVRSMLLSLPGQLSFDLAIISSAPEVSARILISVKSILDELSNFKYNPKEYERRVRERQGWLKEHDDEADS